MRNEIFGQNYIYGPVGNKFKKSMNTFWMKLGTKFYLLSEYHTSKGRVKTSFKYPVK